MGKRVYEIETKNFPNAAVLARTYSQAGIAVQIRDQETRETRCFGIQYFVFIALAIAGCEQRSPTILETSSDSSELVEISQSQSTDRVIAIIDGDTLDVLRDQKQLRIRLNGIDAPEKGQPFGNSAKKSLSDLTFGKDVRIEAKDADRYGRMIADVYIDDTLVNLALVELGLAWHYKEYSDDERLARAEEIARSENIGLWLDKRFVAPWDWRQLSKEERDRLR